jgi:hypothetical protein
LPEGATRLGVILASDATQLTTGTGDLSAHPLFITLDNIDSATRCKTSTNGLMLLALLPKVKFNMGDRYLARALRDRIFHACIRSATSSLRSVARFGQMMSDGAGRLRNCYTVLSAYIVDHPEATRLAGVTASVSPTTQATSREFGDAEMKERRWFSITKETIEKIKEIAHPVDDIEEFVRLSARNNLTGVDKLLWDGWDHCEPAIALCFDLLHSAHKFWNDHPFHWCKNAISAKELDARFKCLQPRVGWKHFNKGVTTLQKMGCRDHRDIQRYILCVLDGAIPRQLMALIRSFIEYIYTAQAMEVSENDLEDIERLISEFHREKEIVHDRGYRTVPGWGIPKLEKQLGIVATIVAQGNLKGLSTEAPEHAHIDNAKNPFRQTNHKDFYPQMIAVVDKMERLRHFDLATAMLSSGTEEWLSSRPADESPGRDHRDVRKTALLDSLATIQNLRGGKREDHINFFEAVKAIETSSRPMKYKRRVRTFIATPFTAIHLNRDPSIPQMTILDAMERFQLPDLLPAIQDYYYHQLHLSGSLQPSPIIARPSSQATELEFDSIRVWFSLRVQTRSVLTPGDVNKPATIYAEPPSRSQNGKACRQKTTWSKGRYDCALFINDDKAAFFGKVNLTGELSW